MVAPPALFAYIRISGVNFELRLLLRSAFYILYQPVLLREADSGIFSTLLRVHRVVLSRMQPRHSYRIQQYRLRKGKRSEYQSSNLITWPAEVSWKDVINWSLTFLLSAVYYLYTWLPVFGEEMKMCYFHCFYKCVSNYNTNKTLS